MFEWYDFLARHRFAGHLVSMSGIIMRCQGSHRDVSYNALIYHGIVIISEDTRNWGIRWPPLGDAILSCNKLIDKKIKKPV
jgi:hypothetical protein